jgi:hypothetical protein
MEHTTVLTDKIKKQKANLVTNNNYRFYYESKNPEGFCSAKTSDHQHRRNVLGNRYTLLRITTYKPWEPKGKHIFLKHTYIAKAAVSVTYVWHQESKPKTHNPNASLHKRKTDKRFTPQ